MYMSSSSHLKVKSASIFIALNMHVFYLECFIIRINLQIESRKSATGILDNIGKIMSQECDIKAHKLGSLMNI